MAKTGAKIIKFEGKENYGEDKYLGFRENYCMAMDLWKESGGKVVYLPFVRQEPNRWRLLLEVRTQADIDRVMRLPWGRQGKTYFL